jgi:hypothetical protein
LLSPSSLSSQTVSRGKKDPTPHLLTFHAYNLQAVLCSEFSNPKGSMNALQILFRALDRNDLPVSPSVLIEAFGWSRREVQEAQDFFEFWKLFEELIGREASLDATHRKIFGGTVSYNSSPEVGISRHTKSFTRMYMFFVTHI